MSAVLPLALKYQAKLGFAVLPLKKASKAPASACGVKDATRDPEQAKRWWGNGSGYGVAIACGGASGHLLVLDIDPRSGGDETLGALEAKHGKLPDTVRALTGRGDGGQHFFFRSPAGVSVRGKLGDGLDVKADGGYVVAAPSIHPDSGKPYTWDAGGHPDETPIADAPAWLVDLLTKDPTSSVPGESVSGADARDTVLGAAFESANMLGASLQSGARIARCPWAGEHTDGRGAGDDSSTVLLPSTSSKKWGAFYCSHSHCAHRTFDDVLRALPREAVGAAHERFNLLAPKWLSATAGNPGDGGLTADHTDLRNAEHLVDWYGPDLRFVVTWRKWLASDGKRWVIDETGRAHRCAVRTVRRLLALAVKAQARAVELLAKATAASDESAIAEAKKAEKRAREDVSHAISSQSAKRLGAMLEIAQSDPRLAVHHSALDADPMLLNVDNGTIDLRTGKLRKHQRADLITKLAPVTYDTNAKAPTFLAFLTRAMGGDATLVQYIKRLAGYSLTGQVREHILIFCFGVGANGKSTFLGLLHVILGDYATPAPRGLLFRARGERHPTELASLHGRRFVTCSEIEEGHAFDEALTKDLTGGDPIEARRMREDFWSYVPTHKLWMAGNHKPTVRGDDEGIWRRMRLVPWMVVIPETERDTELPAKLRAESPGVLAWAVSGCLEWQREGLAAPEAVRKATAQYRAENDVLGQFFAEYLVFEPGAVVARSELRETYLKFCEETGAEPFGAKRFSGRLREHEVTETTARMKRTGELPRVVNAWRGVRLKLDAERVATSAWTQPTAPAPKPAAKPAEGPKPAAGKKGGKP